MTKKEQDRDVESDVIRTDEREINPHDASPPSSVDVTKLVVAGDLEGARKILEEELSIPPESRPLSIEGRRQLRVERKRRIMKKIRLGKIYASAGDSDQTYLAKIVSGEALADAQAYEDPELQGLSLSNLGSISLIMGDFESARMYNEMALSIFSDSSDPVRALRDAAARVEADNAPARELDPSEDQRLNAKWNREVERILELARSFSQLGESIKPAAVEKDLDQEQVRLF